MHERKRERGGGKKEGRAAKNRPFMAFIAVSAPFLELKCTKA